MRWIRLAVLVVPWLGTWIVARQARRDHERARRMLDEMNDIKLRRMEVSDSELFVELAAGSLAARLWAGIWLGLLDQHEAPNFLEFKLGESPDASNWVVVTVRRWHGTTPAEKLRQAEADIKRLRASQGQP